MHVLTVNDYLAARDADRFRPLLGRAGLTAAAIAGTDTPQARRSAYAADVTWLTPKEAAADHLRDGLVAVGGGGAAGLVGRLVPEEAAGHPGRGGQVQRGLASAIVDEADSLLIDEAVTPLILSGAGPAAGVLEADVRHAHSLARRLDPGRHFRIDARHRDVDLTPAGRALLDGLTARDHGLWRSPRAREELVVRALTARHLHHRGQHYVIQDGKVVIVDEATGRLMPDRSWQDGLHQAVEVKEGVAVTPAKRTMARLSFQSFFRRYRRLTGMSGTVAEAAGELWATYALPMVRIPPHCPCRRMEAGVRIVATAARRWDAVLAEAATHHATGRPVLIGTRSVAASEAVSRRLTRAGLAHTVLNAVNHAHEAEIVARAGQRGAVTVATNMAGRGTDIVLGDGVADLGGLHVIATELHESRRVDRQLFGRAGRQGDPGSAVAIVSLEDELAIRHARSSWLCRVLRQGSPALSLRLAQHHAGARAAAARRWVQDQDRQLEEWLSFV